MATESEDPRYGLTAEESKAWRKIKIEPNTREDWRDLLETITAYKRRRIARHSPTTSCGVDSR